MSNNVESIGKWPIRFSGGPKEIPVDQFIRRYETLARMYGIPQSAMTLGLQQLLTGVASSWFWTFITDNPNSSWAQTQATLKLQFQTVVSDEAIHRQIRDRMQRPGERFTEFQIAIQELEVRLAVRMSEPALLETLRRNMLPHLQDRLLFLEIYSKYDLLARVHQIEGLTQQQVDVQPHRRYIPRVQEIVAHQEQETELGVAQSYPQNFSVPPPSIGDSETRSNPFAQQMSLSDPICSPNEQTDFMCAVEPVNRNQLVICWNCDEMGHTFMDCAARRIIFCYGCGTKNVVRPNCQKCVTNRLQGNGNRSVRPNRIPSILPRQSEQQLQHLTPYRRPQ